MQLNGVTMIENLSFLARIQMKTRANRKACCHSGSRGFWGQACARGRCTQDPLTFALKTRLLLFVQGEGFQIRRASDENAPALERMSSLEVNCPSLQRDTPTLCCWPAGWLAGGHLHPVKMLVYIQMTPLLGSPQLGSAWKPLLCVGKVFPPALSVIAGSEKAACASDVPVELAFGLAKRTQ